VIVSLLALALFAFATPTAAQPAKPLVREIFVPFADLDALLENQPQRVLLPRAEYEELLKQAARSPDRPAPRAALVASADYVGTVEGERARFTGTLSIEVLEDGLHSLPLDFSGVALRRAALDGKPAPIAQLGPTQLGLIVQGKGRHELILEAVAPLETTAARQSLAFRLPQPPSARFRLTAPGDVEIKSGASVVAREVDAAARVTRFELLPAKPDAPLVMSLNSHLQRKQRAVVAQSVLVDEITQAYERLHATVSLKILHQAVDRFRFVVPQGFEVTEVTSPLLSRWAIETEGDRKVLDVRLREPALETVVLNLSAIKLGAPADRWSLPRLEPLDVVGQSAVVGLLVEDRLGAEDLAPSGLLPIDLSVFNRAMPPTVLKAEPGAPTLRPIVAYYAPQAAYALSGKFPRPPAEMTVNTNLLLSLSDQGQEVRGGFLLMPAVEKLFVVEFSVPAGWHVTGVTAADNKPLAFERFGPVDQAGRIQVRLPQAVEPGKESRIFFTAKSTPAGWLAEWESFKVAFPVFALAKATQDLGAVAVSAADDLIPRPETLQGLTPLNENEKAGWSLGGVATRLAYRYDRQPYQAAFVVQRTKPRLTARTFSFLRIEPEKLAAHYEVVYQVEEARTRQVSLLLPAETPLALNIRGLDNVPLKEYLPEAVAGGMRRWNVLLAQPSLGRIRLAIDFEQPLDTQKAKKIALPLVRAAGVAHQSGLVAVEGNSELDVQVITDAGTRRVDIGELVEAIYQPGRRLLGAFGFVGDPPSIQAETARHDAYGVFPAIVQQARLQTHLSAAGVSQTEAVFDLRTKALYLQIELPEDSELWSVLIDGKPARPQRENGRTLVNLAAAAAGQSRQLKIVYQAPVRAVAVLGNVALSAPRLRFRSEGESEAVEVPVADVRWKLVLPNGYEVTRSRGSVTTPIAPPEPAAITFAKALGAVFFYRVDVGVGGMQTAREAARRDGGATAPSPYYMSDDMQYFPPGKSAPGGKPSSAPAGAQTGMGMGPQARYASPSMPATPPPGFRAPARDEPKDEAKREEPAAEKAPMPKAEPAQPEPAPTTKDQSGEKTAETPPLADKGKQDGKEIEDTKGVTKYTAVKPAWQRRFEGFRSLDIGLAGTGPVASEITFQSLGDDPRLEITLANRPRMGLIGAVLAAIVAVTGLAMTNRPLRTRVRFVALVVLVGTTLPMLPGLDEFAWPMNLMVFAACLLAVYYVLIAVARVAARLVGRLVARLRGVKPAAVAAALLIAVIAAASPAVAQPPAAGTYVIQPAPPPEPVKVPDDAVILPYDPDSKTGIQDVKQLLVPYAKYTELWNLAHPDKRMQEKLPPSPYALAGASYATTLEGNDFLTLDGQIEIEVYADPFVLVPLRLEGGVLTKAELDGQPARLSVAQATPVDAGKNPNPPQPGPQSAVQQAAQQAAPVQAGSPPPPAGAMAVVHVSGKGRHRLNVAVRMRLERRGGWRVVEGALPTAPATSLSIAVPQSQTEVRLGQALDRRNYETEKPGEKIESALALGGAVSVQWRPRVAEGQVDRSLTVRSTPVFDVQEDGLRLVWPLAMQFGRSQRESFTLHVPADYLVEKVEGANVRGWEVKKEQDRQVVEVALLKAVRESESLVLRLWRAGAVGKAPLADFTVPQVRVADAALESGQVLIRRSPLLDVRTIERLGVTRTDLSAPGPAAGVEESPLGIRPLEAYEFATMPFSLRLSAAPVEERATAQVRMILRLGEHERKLDAQIDLDVQGRPIHRVAMFLPDGMKVEQVVTPVDHHWALTREQERPLLTIYLAAGRQGSVPVVVRGVFERQGMAKQIPLPRLELRDVQRQEGEIAVQADPAYEVTPEQLTNLQPLSKGQVASWLKPEQFKATEAALRYTQPDYRGTLRVNLRPAEVSCETITNVRVTDRAVEETIILAYMIRQAGIREVSFVLPAWMKDSRIEVPSLRQKTIEPAGPGEDAPIRVRLELQDEVMESLVVRVLNDRLLAPEGLRAPIPKVLGTVRRQFVIVESAGRDEVVVEGLQEMEPLAREQPEFRELEARLKGKITQAYAVRPQAQDPRLSFKTMSRETVQAVGARIGLAETTLVLDPHGAYRAAVTFRLNNATEQFLAVELPEGAALWTAWVAGEPVKPAQAAGAGDRVVRVPLVKTAPGDRDYSVVLKYGGRMGPLDTVAKVQFPLVRTQNIEVEQSHVRLHLPESYSWFKFDGTMRRAEESELSQEKAAYEGKAVQRLVDTYRQATDPFAKVRALNNLKQQVTTLNDSSSSMSVRENATVLHDAEQVLRQADQPASKEEIGDNRKLLNDLYAEQRNGRAKNVVSNLDSNWSLPANAAAPQGEQAGAGLNPQWLTNSRLENPADPNAAKGDKDARNAPGDAMNPQGQSRVSRGRSQGQDQQVKGFRGPGITQSQPQSTTPGPKANEPAQDAAPASQRELLDRYQVQLERQSQQEANGQRRDREKALDGTQLDRTTTLKGGAESGKQVQGGEKGQPMPGGDIGGVGGEGGQPGKPGQAGPGGGGQIPGMGGSGSGVGGPGPVLTAKTPPTDVLLQPEALGWTAGLASQDVEIPTRGAVFLFTTPRGEVEITGRAVAEDTVGKLIRLAIVLAVVLVLAAIVLRVSRVQIGRQFGRVVPILLAVVGVVVLLSGFVLAGFSMLGLAIAILGSAKR
jgi:hypothetical protein